MSHYYGGGGGGYHGGRQRFNKRRRTDEYGRQSKHAKEDTQDELRLLTAGIADMRPGEANAPLLISKTDSVAQALENHLAEDVDFIVGVIMDCVLALPSKIPIYGSLSGLLNARDVDFGARLAQRLDGDIQKNLRAKDVSAQVLKCHLRFAAELTGAGLLHVSGIVGLLNVLLDSAESGEGTALSRDIIVYLILLTLPWAGQFINEKNGGDLDTIMDRIQGYMEGEAEGTCQFHGMSDIWEGILDLQRMDWATDLVLSPSLAFYDALLGAVEHDLNIGPDMTVSRRVDDDLNESKSAPWIGLFDASVATKDMSALGRNLLRDHVYDILKAFPMNPIEGSNQLMTIAFPVPYEYFLVECIMSELLRAPTTTEDPLYYGVLLINLCKTLPQYFPIVAIAVEVALSKMDSLSPAVLDRFAEWFAFHISNFEYKWEWHAWANISNMERGAPKRVFLEHVLEKCVRLSYHDRFTRLLPATMHSLVPPKPDPVVSFESLVEGTDKAVVDSFITTCGGLLRDKAPLDSLKKAREDAAVGSLGEEAATDAYMHCLLMAGVKSLSHMMTALDRYGLVLSDLQRPSQLLVLKRIWKFWANSRQLATVVTDKVVEHGIVDEQSMVEFILGGAWDDQYASVWLWNLLDSVIVKTKVAAIAQGTDPDTARSCQKKILLLILAKVSTLLEGDSQPDQVARLMVGRAAAIARKHVAVLEGCEDELHEACKADSLHKAIKTALK